MKKTIRLYLSLAAIGIALAGCAGGNSDIDEGDISGDGIPVTVDSVRVMTLHGYAEAYGTVVPDPGTVGVPAANVRITAPSDGVIARVNCTENQTVRAGDVLFVFDTTFADAAVENARSILSTAEKALERQKQMQAIDATSDRDYLVAEQQYESARSDLTAAMTARSLLDVKAPIAGTMSNIAVRPGETVTAADMLAELADYQHLAVTATVPAAESMNLAAGQSVHITTDIARNSDSNPVTGTVRYVSGSIDPQNGSVEVLVALPAGAQLRPGQFVQVSIALSEHADCLVVPHESVVIDTEGRATVAVVSDDEAVFHTIRPGITENGLTEILDSDLAPGMMVVVSGVYGLPDHSIVQITNR